MAEIKETSPIEGIEIRRNPKNRFIVFQIHYSANPKKRDPAYLDDIKSSMPRAQFMQEYELRWDSFAGLPVYGDFDSKRHLAQTKPFAIPGLPLLLGIDFGLTPACVVAQLQGETLVILKEFTETNMGADRFTDKFLAQCRILWPAWSDLKKHWKTFMDPAGEQRKDTDEGTCAKILDSKGLVPIAGAIGFEERRKAVEHFLLRQTKEGPCLQIWGPECPVLVRGFEGGYRYPEKSTEVEPHKLRPIKDVHSHCHDALQYLASRVIMLKQTMGVPIPRADYGWNR